MNFRRQLRELDLTEVIAALENELMQVSESEEKKKALRMSLEEFKKELPKVFSISQNYPNPFSSASITQLSYALPKDAEVKIEIYNLIGEHVKTLVNQTIEAGIHTIMWDGRNDIGDAVPTGIYFLKFNGNGYKATRKLLVIN